MPASAARLINFCVSVMVKTISWHRIFKTKHLLRPIEALRARSAGAQKFARRRTKEFPGICNVAAAAFPSAVNRTLLPLAEGMEMDADLEPGVGLYSRKFSSRGGKLSCLDASSKSKFASINSRSAHLPRASNIRYIHRTSPEP